MANTIILKHGSSIPGRGVLRPYELGYIEDQGLVIGTENGAVIIGGTGSGSGGQTGSYEEILQLIENTVSAKFDQDFDSRFNNNFNGRFNNSSDVQINNRFNSEFDEQFNGRFNSSLQAQFGSNPPDEDLNAWFDRRANDLLEPIEQALIAIL